MIRIGFWGTGEATGVAAWHADAFQRDGRACLAAVYNRTLARSERWAGQFSRSIRICRNEQELWENSDAVVICTPNSLHIAQAQAAMQAGCHVLLEKPLCGNDVQRQSLLDTARQHHVFGALGYVYRFADPVIQMRKLLRERFDCLYTVNGRLGGIRLADPRIPMEWRMRREIALAGALYDMGSHLVDTASRVCGQQMEEIFCQTQTCIGQRPGKSGRETVETDDAGSLSGRAGRTIYSMMVSRTGPGPLQLTVTGDGGMLDLQIGSGLPLCFWEKDRHGGYSSGGPKAVCSGPSIQQEWFCRQASAFLDGIEGRENAIAGFEEGGYVDRVLAAALRSAQTGRIEAV